MQDDPLRDCAPDPLRSVPGHHGRPMFGGDGLRLDGMLSGLVFQGRFYLKNDTAARQELLVRRRQA